MRRERILVAAVWLAFVVRGAYYCGQVPLWEGLDEWAHAGAVEYFAEHGRMPARTDLVSDRIVRSLELAPLPWSNNGWVAGAANHDDYWLLPEAERARRRGELAQLTARYRRPASLSPSIQRQYEAQQPPLYYALMAVPWRLTQSWPIERQVAMLRLIGVLIASTAIPLTYRLARRHAASRRGAILVCALVAAMPATMQFVARAGNDALAFALITAGLYALIVVRRGWLLAGLLLGLALLTKAYALVLIPVYAIAALRRRSALASLAAALAIGGWWYAGNLASTGAIAADQMELSAHAPFSTKLAAIPRVRWTRAVDSSATTHIWIGGWSFLQVRSWMYRVWEAIAVLAAAGLLRLGRRTGWQLLLTQFLFFLALAWLSLNAFLAAGISTGTGWYAVAGAAAEATLLACGFTGLLGVARAWWAMASVVTLAAAFDLYTVHFLLAPYYTGLIRHRADGSLQAFHWTAMPQFPALWPAYLAATVGLVVLAFSARNEGRITSR